MTVNVQCSYVVLTSLSTVKISPLPIAAVVPKIQVSTPSRHRYDTNFADTDVDELVAMLRETENLEEQGDILQYLVDTQGLDYNTGKLCLVLRLDENYCSTKWSVEMLLLVHFGCL